MQIRKLKGQDLERRKKEEREEEEKEDKMH